MTDAVDRLAPPDAETVAWLAERSLRLERGQDLEGNDVWFLADAGGRIGESGFLTIRQAVGSVEVGDEWLADTRRFLDGDLGRPDGGSAGV